MTESIAGEHYPSCNDRCHGESHWFPRVVAHDYAEFTEQMRRRCLDPGAQ